MGAGRIPGPYGQVLETEFRQAVLLFGPAYVEETVDIDIAISTCDE